MGTDDYDNPLEGVWLYVPDNNDITLSVRKGKIAVQFVYGCSDNSSSYSLDVRLRLFNDTWTSYFNLAHS